MTKVDSRISAQRLGALQSLLTQELRWDPAGQTARRGQREPHVAMPAKFMDVDQEVWPCHDQVPNLGHGRVS